MPSLHFVTLDVFTSTRFQGNPLAVVTIPTDQQEEVTTTQLQAIAREFNLSETIFLFPSSPNSDSDIPEWRARIFLTDAEIPFAGHPIIGAACYILGHLAPGAKQWKLLCNAGSIGIDYANGVAKALIPHRVHRHVEGPVKSVVHEVLASQPGLRNANARIHKADVVSPVIGMTFVCIELADVETLAKVSTTSQSPKIVLDEAWRTGFVGCYFYVVLNKGNEATKIRTRMVEGTLEDPATGSAACALSACLALEWRQKTNDLEIVQGVEMGRKSEIGVRVTLKGDLDEVQSIELSGMAMKVMEGTVEYD